MGKIKIYMVCSNCHAERFEKIDWPKKIIEKEEINFTKNKVLLNFLDLDNPEFIQLLWD